MRKGKKKPENGVVEYGPFAYEKCGCCRMKIILDVIVLQQGLLMKCMWMDFGAVVVFIFDFVSREIVSGLVDKFVFIRVRDCELERMSSMELESNRSNLIHVSFYTDIGAFRVLIGQLLFC